MGTRRDQMSEQQTSAGLLNIRMPEVVQRTGLSKSEIYRRIRRNEFPKQKKLGYRTSVWSAAQVEQWKKSVFDPDIENLLA